MKKSLLLLGAALLMTASAMAQTYSNTRTKAGPPAFADVATYNYAAAEGGDTLYLWNVKYGGFYTNHRSPNTGWPYGTRSSVNDTIGSKVVFTQVNPAGGDTQTEDAAFFTENPDAYLLVSYVSKFDEYRCTFAEWFDGLWTDNNTTNNRYFVPFVAGNYLRIHPTGNVRNEMPVEWDTYNLCVRPVEVDGWRCVFFNLPEYEEENTETGEVTKIGIPTDEEVGEDWAIVSPTVYDVWIVESKDQNTRYTLGDQLAAALNKAVADTDDGIRPDLAAQVAVLNNVDATPAELQAAIDAIPDIVVAYQVSKVTPWDPANFTTKINNPDFTNANLGGWTGSGWGRAGVADDAAERYHMNFDTYQDIKDLPAGVYRVMVDGFCRAGEAQEDYNAMKAGTVPNPKLYVGCTTFGEFETPMHHASDAALTTDPGYDNSSSVTWEGTTYYIPNSMKAFVGYVQNSVSLGLGERPYGIAAYGALEEGESLRIGARNENGANDWVIVDNFELWYLGNTLEAYKLWAAQVNLPEADPSKYYGQPDLDAYNAVRTALSDATTKEAIMEAVKGVGAAEDLLAASNAAYEKYVAEIDGFSQWMADNDVNQETEEFGKLYIYMMEYEEPNGANGYPNGSAKYIIDYENGATVGTLSAEDINAELELISDMKKAALSVSLHKNMSLTYLITNPDFEESPAGKGWTETHTGNINLRGGLASNYCAEVWNGTFDVHQKIEDPILVPGLYKVTVRAFQRTGGNASAWADWISGEAKVTTEVYLNEFSTPVANLQSVQYIEKMGNHRAEATHDVEGTTVYTLDDMNGASKAFALSDTYADYLQYDPAKLLSAPVQANFKQDVFGLITKEEAGQMTLGIRCQIPGKDGDYWSLWDKFEVTYMGKDFTGLKEVLEDYLGRDANLNSETICADDYEAWDKAMQATAGYERITPDANGDSDQLYDMVIDLAKAYNKCLESETVMPQLETALTELEGFLWDHEDFMDPDVYDEIDAWTQQVREKSDPAGDGSVAPEGTVDDYKKYLEECAEYLEKAKLSLIDFDTLPANVTAMIVNPRYENNNNTGWSGTTPGFQSYRNAEVYQGTFDTYQTVKLPKDGYYRLSVRGFERFGSAADDYAVETAGTYADNTNAVLYAKVGEETYSHHITHLAKGAVTDAEMANFTGAWQTVGDNLHVTDDMNGASSFFYYYENDQSNLEENADGELVVIDPTAGYFFNQIFFKANAGEAVIGLKKETRKQTSRDWCCWADWQLWYFGEEVPTGIEEIQNTNAIAAPTQRSIYNLGGAKVNQLQRGFNIVRTVDAEGNVKVQKIFVK